MRTQPFYTLSLIFILLTLLIAACTGGPTPQPLPDLEEIVALTQTAAAADLPPTSTPEPPTPTTPSRTQVEAEGVRFSYDPALGAEVQAEIEPAAPWMPAPAWLEDFVPGPWVGVPDSLRFTFTRDDPGFLNAPDSVLFVHPVRDATGQFYPAIEQNAPVREAVDRLAANLANGVLPSRFFEGDDGSQVNTHVRRIEFQNGSGYAAVVHLPGERGPVEFTNAGLYYVFDGLTHDNRYYVSFRYRVSAPGIPNAPALSDEEMQAFVDDPEAYFAYARETAGALNNVSQADFSPSLQWLDSLVISLRVAPTLPEPTELPPAACTDGIELVSESVPDETAFSPGQAFSKSWRLKNIGTCTWTPSYALVFVEGEQLGGESPVPLPESVSPEGSIELTVNLTAPDAPGDYESRWKLRNARGEVFGLGRDAATPFWARITVIERASGPNLGAPTWVDKFDRDANNWYLGAGENIGFELKDGDLIMTAFKPTGDNWRVAEKPPLVDFYLEARFKTGETCAGKDSYGLIVRSPEAADNIIDTGYVFIFACDGNFRYYRMDDGVYVGMQGWTPAPQLLAGAEQTNVMGVMVEGETFKLYANGALIAQFTDSSHAQGLFGLVIRAEQTEGFQVFVEEIAYWLLPR